MSPSVHPATTCHCSRSSSSMCTCKSIGFSDIWPSRDFRPTTAGFSPRRLRTALLYHHHHHHQSLSWRYGALVFTFCFAPVATSWSADSVIDVKETDRRTLFARFHGINRILDIDVQHNLLRQDDTIKYFRCTHQNDSVCLSSNASFSVLCCFVDCRVWCSSARTLARHQRLFSHRTRAP